MTPTTLISWGLIFVSPGFMLYAYFVVVYAHGVVAGSNLSARWTLSVQSKWIYRGVK